MVDSIAPQDLKLALESGEKLILIDVRTPVEFRELHVKTAVNTPLDRLTSLAVEERRGDSTVPVYVICLKGSRGQKACEQLIANGVEKVINVEGGTLACEAAGLPLVRGPKAVSLERQVRIAAGSLVLVGSMLGFFVHPYWIAVSSFVGVGLVFAGVTDTCGMAMLLGRMPWNQIVIDET